MSNVKPKATKSPAPPIKSVIPFGRGAYAYEIASLAYIERSAGARTKPSRGCE